MIGEGELIRGSAQPGKRMGSMMSPMVALDDHGALAAIAGAAGGSRIRPALVQCVLRMLRGETPQDAIDAPRLNALPDLVRLEPGFSAEVFGALEAAGDTVAVADRSGPLLRRGVGAQLARRRRRSAAQRLRDHDLMRPEPVEGRFDRLSAHEYREAIQRISSPRPPR